MNDANKKTAPKKTAPKKTARLAPAGLVPGCDTFEGALLEFQRRCPPAVLDSKNPQYNSAFASLSSMIRSAGPALNACGFAYSFRSEVSEDDRKAKSSLVLLHPASGSERTYPGPWLPIAGGRGNPAHAVRGAHTYGKRGVFADSLGIDTGPGDDVDGNAPAASGWVFRDDPPPMPPRAAAVVEDSAAVAFRAEVDARRRALDWPIARVRALIHKYGAANSLEVAAADRAALLAEVKAEAAPEAEAAGTDDS